MKRSVPAAVAAFVIILTLTACGGGSSAPPTVVAQILTDSVYDGDIARDSTGQFTITQSMSPTVQSVFAGRDPARPIEYRSFLDFPLTGTNGVPGNAFIQSATLDIVIDNVFLGPLSATIPIRVDLVSFQPPNLIQTDFDPGQQPAILATTIVPPIAQSDAGHHVPIDVTLLMREVQRLNLPDFQVRILEDPLASDTGLIEINDTTGADRDFLAPLLQVVYY